jgi:hypothetical protein
MKTKTSYLRRQLNHKISSRIVSNFALTHDLNTKELIINKLNHFIKDLGKIWAMQAVA